MANFLLLRLASPYYCRDYTSQLRERDDSLHLAPSRAFERDLYPRDAPNKSSRVLSAAGWREPGVSVPRLQMDVNCGNEKAFLA